MINAGGRMGRSHLGFQLLTSNTASVAYQISDELKAESTDLFNVGDLAFWPPGNAFCIFWGPTPASEKDEIRAASPANLIGKIIDNPLDLSSVSSGEEIIIKVSE